LGNTESGTFERSLQRGEDEDEGKEMNDGFPETADVVCPPDSTSNQAAIYPILLPSRGGGGGGGGVDALKKAKKRSINWKRIFIRMIGWMDGWNGGEIKTRL